MTTPAAPSAARLRLEELLASPEPRVHHNGRSYEVIRAVGVWLCEAGTEPEAECGEQADCELIYRNDWRCDWLPLCAACLVRLLDQSLSQSTATPASVP